MKIIFFGTDAFAAVNLEALVSGDHELAVCVTAPDRARGRGLKVLPCPVKETALKHKLPVLQPETLKSPETVQRLRSFAADVFVVIAYGKILPPDILQTPKLCAVNAHASLLPKYRGAAPINWAIINGEKETGISVIRMNEHMDAGDVMGVARLPIADDDTSVTLRERLAEVSARCLLETLDRLGKGTVSYTPQDQVLVTVAPKLTKGTGRVAWKEPAERIHLLARGLLPWPTAHTFFNGRLLKLIETSVVPASGTGGVPGEILEVSPEGIRVATGRDELLVRRVHPESSHMMDAAAFAAGHKVGPGCRLGSPSS